MHTTSKFIAPNKVLFGNRTRGKLAKVLVRASVLLLSCHAAIVGPPIAQAGEGAIELNSVSVAAGGITPGDTAGFPATLSLPGHYVLTGNLQVPDSSTTAIDVTAANVIIDLNGFAISAPPLCAGDPVVCSPAGTGVGVSGSAEGTTVSHGVVRGLGNNGIAVGPLARIDRVEISLNAGNGLEVGAGSEVRENRIERNGGEGLVAGDGSLIVDNMIRGNLGLAMELQPDAGYGNNIVSSNMPPQIVGGTELGANACPLPGCSGGECPVGQVSCAGLCVSPESDEDHCGACESPCAAGERCETGVCTLSCQSGLENCSGVCVNTSTDEAYCGDCFTSCNAGEACIGGSCAVECQVGLTVCQGTCANLATDFLNCGNCGTTCAVGEVCNAGNCEVP